MFSKFLDYHMVRIKSINFLVKLYSQIIYQQFQELVLLCIVFFYLFSTVLLLRSPVALPVFNIFVALFKTFARLLNSGFTHNILSNSRTNIWNAVFHFLLLCKQAVQKNCTRDLKLLLLFKNKPLITWIIKLQ